MDFDELNEVKIEKEDETNEAIEAENTVEESTTEMFNNSPVVDEYFKEPEYVSVAAKEVIVPEASYDQILKESKIAFYSRQLILALLGIAFSFVFGFGIIFSLIAFARSVGLLKSSKSTFIKWAFWLSIVGFIINLFFIVTFITFVSIGPIDPNVEPIVTP